MGAPRVLFCTDGIFPHVVGGIQRHSRLLIEELARGGRVELAVVHPHGGERVFDEALGVREIPVAPPGRRRHYLVELHDYSRRVHAAARELDDHLVYSQGLATWHGASDLSDRLVVNPHGLEFYQAIGLAARLKAIPYRWIHRRLFAAATRVVCFGGHLTGILRRKVPQPDEQVVVIPNATVPPDLPEEDLVRTGSGSPIRCLFVGRLETNKGVDDLVAAAALLESAGEGEDFTFSVAGKGPLHQELSQRSLPASVDLLGFVSDDDLARLYRDHDLFVLPTLYEGMPTVVLEAMAHGLPIAVTDVGATREMVSDDNGFIVPKRSPEGLVRAFRAFRDLPPGARSDMSRHSFRLVRERFTWDAVARRHEGLFAELAGG